jgi:hypothetical protein
MATEEAKYTVLEHEGDFELRQYQPHIIAKTLVVGDFKNWETKAFGTCMTISPARTARSNPSP